MFITFEGIDGSGKTTQLNLLADYLVEKGYEVIKLREPGGTILSEKIRELLLDKSIPIPPMTELLLFNSARSFLVETIIKPAIESGKIVLCDRFYDSTTAYQAFGRELNYENVITINDLAAGGLIPDLTFYIDIDLETHKIRTLGKDLDRMESSGDEFYKKVIEGYRKLSETNENRIKKIISKNEISDTFNEIIDIFENKFNKI
jgi:dTMP kinase